MQATVEKHDVTQPKKPIEAPGRPGAKPRWSSGAKAGVGAAVANCSRIWFTISNGTLNEIYFPDIDKANTRSIRFLITEGTQFLSDEETDATHEMTSLGEGIPGYVIKTMCEQSRYRLEKEIVSDPARDCLLVRVRFEPSSPSMKLYVLIDPQLADQGSNNDAWIGSYKEIPMLFASHRDTSLAALCSVPFVQATCGFVGRSDGLKQLKKNGRITRAYNSAKKGNVTMLAEIDWQSKGGEFVLSVAFGGQPAEAAQQARAGLLQRFDDVRSLFIDEWKREQSRYREMARPEGQTSDLYRVSAAVLQAHESKRFPGGFIASLSIPWGFAKGDKDIGGYHVVWPRDLVEAAMGKLACGDVEAARRAVFYLACTQSEAGNWSQNMWLDGTVHWGAEQMDAIAMPILLADRLSREDELGSFDPWPMVRKAARFLITRGPGTQQGRWEAVGGFSIFTMCCEVAALLAAADCADKANEVQTAAFLRSTADAWNDAIDEYTYVEGTDLAKEHEVEGYYIRTAPFSALEDRPLKRLRIVLPNHVFGNKSRRAVDIVSPDALALVRFGLRPSNDPRILQTIRVLDATLRKELTTGPGWVRSTHDGYGERADGRPFEGRGIGRCWPLLAGERGHYEVAAGNTKAAEHLLNTMAAQSSVCGMIPEQVWDGDDLPKHQLYNGRPSGSGMPLAWAHAEYVKLMRSINEGKVWDMPPQTVQRYQVERRSSPYQIWTESEPREWVRMGKQLRVDLSEPAEIQWSVDPGKQEQSDVKALVTESAIEGIHSAVLALPERWKELRIDVQQSGKKRSLILHSR